MIKPKFIPESVLKPKRGVMEERGFSLCFFEDPGVHQFYVYRQRIKPSFDDAAIRRIGGHPGLKFDITRDCGP